MGITEKAFTLICVVSICSGLAQVSDSRLHRALHKTIPERVQESGNLSMAVVTERPPIPDLKTLTSMSDLVIAARPLKSVPNLTREGLGIWTDITVRITEVVRSSTTGRPPESLVITVLGGKIKFPNGTAEFVDSDLPPRSLPKSGQEYLFFIIQSTQDPDKYQLVGGSQGAYQVQSGKIVPVTQSGNPLYSLTRGKSREGFVQEIRRGEWKRQ